MLLAWAIINCRVRLRPPAGTRCSWIASSGDSPRAPGISTVLSSFGSFGGVSFLMSHLCGGSLEITGSLEAQYLQSMTIRGWVKEHGLLWLPATELDQPARAVVSTALWNGAWRLWHGFLFVLFIQAPFKKNSKALSFIFHTSFFHGEGFSQ